MGVAFLARARVYTHVLPEHTHTTHHVCEHFGEAVSGADCGIKLLGCIIKGVF